MSVHSARTRVKVCGITSTDDAVTAVQAGADAVGVILFADSPRAVSIPEAAAILRDVPPFVARVGVFVDAEEDYVEEAVARAGLSVVQFHGAETPERCAAAPLPVIKAFKVGPHLDYEDIRAYAGSVSAILLDTYVKGSDGGSGITFAWNDHADVPRIAPLVVAGGLDPTNVGTAIRALRPFGVDVCSGVEERHRLKDRTRTHAFLAAVHAADLEGP